MPRVPAGDSTGVYHIPICALPWNCSWQKLKDFARNQQADGSCIDVDLAVVYPDSTNGHIKVVGKENFSKAMEHLDGGQLGHKCLIADGRNESGELVLPESVVKSSNMSRRGRKGSTGNGDSRNGGAGNGGRAISSTYDHYPTDATYYYQPQQPGPNYSPASATYPTTSYYPPAPIYEPPPSPYFHPPVPYSVTPQTSIVYAGDMAPLTPIGIYVPPQPGYTYVVPVTLPAPYQEPPPPSSTYRETPAPQPTILTTARKIIITSLPHPTHRTPLLSLLSTCAGPPIRISSLEIAKHPDGRPKGHAFAVLESHAVAMRVVERINGLKWQGRTLCARLAKEGVEEGEERRTPPLRSSLPDRSRKHYPASSYASSASHSEASSRREAGGVSEREGLGADREGSSRREKEKAEKEQRRIAPPSPAVVDGSHSGTARERRKQKQKET